MSQFRDRFRKSTTTTTATSPTQPEVFGWNNDLTEVPTHTWENLSGATIAQADAALTVENGGLAFDNQLAVNAGANADWKGDLRFAALPDVYANASMAIYLEARSLTESAYGSFFVITQELLDENGDLLTPAGGSQPRIQYTQHSQDGNYKWARFFSGHTWSSSQEFVIIKYGVTHSPVYDRMDMASCSDATFQPGGHSIKNGERGDGDNPIPPLATLSTDITACNHYSGNSANIAWKIHRIELLGIKAD